jgi:hypothetical protein
LVNLQDLIIINPEFDKSITPLLHLTKLKNIVSGRNSNSNLFING